ncbi:unnamed protein product [Diamesa tonsa]
MEEQKRMFELDLAAEKQRAMAAEKKADEKIRNLENLKALNLFKANHIENEKQKNEYQLKSEKQRNYDFEIANILESIQAQKLEDEKLMIEMKLAAEKQLKIIEKEANDKIRKLENDALRQRCDAIKKENKKNILETQLQAEQQRLEDFEMFKELQKIEAETSQTKKEKYKLKLAADRYRIYELEVKMSENNKYQIKKKSELKDLKYSNETEKLNAENLQIQTKLFEANLEVEKQRTLTEKRLAEANEQRFRELEKQQTHHNEVSKLEAAKAAEKEEADKKFMAEKNSPAQPEAANGLAAVVGTVGDVVKLANKVF